MKKFLVKNIVLPINADGEVIDTTVVGVNLLACVIMLAAELEPFQQLSEIFSAPENFFNAAQFPARKFLY